MKDSNENHKAYYRVDIHPLEPYTFGTEQGSKFNGAKVETGKESYIITSENVPDQTTILGTLRYILLEQKGLLRSDFCYGDGEREEMKALIGESSFSFQEDSLQSFGVIQKISPLFLIERCYKQENCSLFPAGKCDRREMEIYIKNPFHNRGNGIYQPIKMAEKLGEKELETSFGKIHLPSVIIGIHGEVVPEYDAKKGHGGGYICLSDKKVAPEDLFRKCLQAGNRTGREGQDDSEGFYKRETVVLKRGFAFSVYVTVSDGKAFPEETIAFMGRKRSAFRFRFTKVEKDDCDLEKKVEDAFSKESGCWYYALSDIYLEETPKYEHFAIVEEKSIRNLETTLNETAYVQKRRKSQHQFHLIERGSVFYKSVDGLEIKNEKMEAIGYNKIVRLGGGE